MLHDPGLFMDQAPSSLLIPMLRLSSSSRTCAHC